MDKYIVTNEGVYSYNQKKNREEEGDTLIAIVYIKDSFNDDDWLGSDEYRFLNYCRDNNLIEEIELL